VNKIKRIRNYLSFLLARRRFQRELTSILPVRHPKLELKKEIFENFFNNVEKYPGFESTVSCISNIWSDIIKNYEINIFQFIDDKNIDRLVSSYEAYYVEGISDGASSGKALNDSSLMTRKTIRNHSRAFTYFEANNHLSAKDIYLQKSLPFIYEDILKNINIPDSIYIGQPWFWSFKNKKIKIHFELIDYVYFSQICISMIGLLKAKKILVLGDGSGVNCALINANLNSSISLVHVDLAQYLLMQYITNYQWTKNSKYIYAEKFNEIEIESVDLMINMDSFPEMTEKEVDKYVTFIKNKKVKYLLSYNHKILDDRHSNFRKYLNNIGMNPIISYPSIIRPGWFVELFKLDLKQH
jgi:hypothetical protein